MLINIHVLLCLAEITAIELVMMKSEVQTTLEFIFKIRCSQL